VALRVLFFWKRVVVPCVCEFFLNCCVFETIVVWSLVAFADQTDVLCTGYTDNIASSLDPD